MITGSCDSLLDGSDSAAPNPTPEEPGGGNAGIPEPPCRSASSRISGGNMEKTSGEAGKTSVEKHRCRRMGNIDDSGGSRGPERAPPPRK